ncbi:dimethyladenosine transferase 1, mitochondrial [Culicoides brevitarsis]|uniref:dimethyladenosine transferase 1, mitochondrial n=1 Tax=Culicoides brevitarsis TaxID=469753 RepID=UPI00307B7D56
MATRYIKSSGARLPPLPTLRDLVKLYKLTAIKQLSQNFLMDERLTDKIVRAAGHIQDHHVLEVGPGPGGITRSILRQCPKQLIVVEKDRRFMPTMELLAEACKQTTDMKIVRGDILKYDMENCFEGCERTDWHGPRAPVHLIGNLPFAISTRLLINWLKDISLKRGAWAYGRTSLTLTFQKEVADRIVAPILSKERCRLSIMSQLWTKPQLRFTIPGTAFVPKPEVDVGVVTFVPHRDPMTDLDFDLVEKMARYLFSMRQKYCRRGIQNLFSPDIREEYTAKIFQLADIDPQLRSFQISNEEFLRLCIVYNDMLKENPDIAKYDYRGPRISRDLCWQGQTEENIEEIVEKS